MSARAQAPTPVAIGGVGGSGTRVVAALLHACGVYLGSDLNEAFDNLWFTLLFKRRRILIEGRAEFDDLFGLFARKMRSGVGPSPRELGRLAALAQYPRMDLTRAWLQARLDTLCVPVPRTASMWGWKEPNTHVVAERILASDDDVRYVHVSRHPLHIAFSSNQRQLAFWGPIFLERDVDPGPRDSFAYWCMAELRARSLAQKFPGRVHYVDFDRFCSAPVEESQRLLTALNIDVAPPQDFTRRVRRPDAEASLEPRDPSNFRAADIEIAAALGYRL
jgi:hypothetical protein